PPALYHRQPYPYQKDPLHARRPPRPRRHARLRTHLRSDRSHPHPPSHRQGSHQPEQCPPRCVSPPPLQASPSPEPASVAAAAEAPAPAEPAAHDASHCNTLGTQPSEPAGRRPRAAKSDPDPQSLAQSNGNTRPPPTL